MIDSYSGLWVFCEQRNGNLKDVAFELTSEGRRLADRLGSELSAVVFGHDVAGVENLAHYGADKIYVADDPSLAEHNEDAYTEILADLIRTHRPEMVLAGATSLGRSFIPRVAAILETGLTADSVRLEIDPHSRLLLQTRPTYGNNVMATIVCPNRRPQMTTVRPHVFKRSAPDSSRKAETTKIQIQKKWLASRTKIISFTPDPTHRVDLDEARIIVCGGRGIGKPENFELLKELADTLGATLACTRPPVDEGWMPSQRQVGQSGRTVRPRLYIGCGVSGAAQHTVGIQDSEVIVAINEDPRAPIFDIATYGVVADLFQVVPLLIKKLQQR